MEKQNPPSDNALKRDILGLIRELLHAALMSSVPAWIDLRLTLPQLRTAFIIAHNNTSSVKDISRQLGIGEPTASHLIDRLVQSGLADRTDDPRDRRCAVVRLSDEGEKMIEKLLDWEKFLGVLLDKISGEDLSSLRKGLKAVMDKYK